MADHDGHYKRLFSHERTVADFLRGYIASEWIGELDLERMETVPPNHISEERQRRHNDIIWRVPWQSSDAAGAEDWLYCYFMLEFQRGINHMMAIRIMVYAGLLYEHLVNSGQCSARALPPLLPIVLYNGEDRWTAATNVAELIPRFPKAFARFIPQVSYLFLDEGRMQTSDQLAEQNLAAAIFQMEQTEVSGVIPFASEVLAWLQSPEQMTLRRDLTTWIETTLLGPERLSELESQGKLKGVEEVDMLAKRAEI